MIDAASYETYGPATDVPLPIRGVTAGGAAADADRPALDRVHDGLDGLERLADLLATDASYAAPAVTGGMTKPCKTCHLERSGAESKDLPLQRATRCLLFGRLLPARREISPLAYGSVEMTQSGVCHWEPPPAPTCHPERSAAEPKLLFGRLLPARREILRRYAPLDDSSEGCGSGRRER